MKNIIKIGLTVVASSILLSGCFDSDPKGIVEDSMKTLKTGDFAKGTKNFSSEYKDQLASLVMLGCASNDTIKNNVVPQLEKEQIDLKILNLGNYSNFTIDIQNKTIGLCYQELAKIVAEKTKDEIMKTLSSEISSSGDAATVKIEESNPNTGQANIMDIKLEKINSEWKITQGLF